jgi:hypothetical protein
MISVGNYSFPDNTTMLHVHEIEAKSKVRKEIRIQSLISRHNESALLNDLSSLRAAMESFDRQLATLSLSPGKYVCGRKRSFQIIPYPAEALAWIDLLILTNDRYERSVILHRHETEILAGRAVFPLFNRGNWLAPLRMTVIPANDISAIHVQTETSEFTLSTPITEGQIAIIDAENRSVLVGNNNAYSAGNEEFPFLQAGSNHLTISIEPSTVTAQCKIEYRDVWI